MLRTLPSDQDKFSYYHKCIELPIPLPDDHEANSENKKSSILRPNLLEGELILISHPGSAICN